MRVVIAGLILCLLSAPLFAGPIEFGIQAGALSPTSSLDNNDNGLVAGAHLKFKIAVVGVKIEAFFVDSSGDYADVLGEEFGQTNIDINNIVAADVMWYPVGLLFFIQGGVHYINMDSDGIDQEVIDNELGLNLGLGVTLFDKLMIQGKVMYTPDAVQSDVLDSLQNLDDENLVGYMVTVGWNF
jgi:hypothetical protein